MSAAATVNAERGASGRPALVLATTVLASSLAFVDGSVVNVGLPAIGRSLEADAAGLQWTVNAYLLPLGALLLFGGALGDRFGQRRLLIVGVMLFALASAACTLAPDIAVLLAARAVQGVGAALLMPNSLGILGASFTGEARGRAVGTWAAAGAGTAAFGPVLGGVLIDWVGWRAIFAIDLPLAAAAILLAWRCLPAGVAARNRPLDPVGAVLATVGLGTFTWALVVAAGPEGPTGPSIGALVLGAGLLAVFVAWEGRRGERAMMPLTLFGSRGFVGLTLLTLLLYGALGGLMVLLPYVLIEVGRYTAASAGLALLPLPLILAALSPLFGGLAGRIGPKPLLVAGPWLAACGFLLMLRIGASPDYWTEVLPAIAVLSVGLGGAVAPLTTAVLSSVGSGHMGSASGFNSAIARTGGLVATASIGFALARHGDALIRDFHLTAVAGAAAAVLAGCSALLLGGTRRAEPA